MSEWCGSLTQWPFGASIVNRVAAYHRNHQGAISLAPEPMSESKTKTITKRELVNRIAEETDQTKVAVRDVIQRFLDSIVDELSQGNRLEFREFGVFEVRERAARLAQNPKTLEKVEVPAKRVVKFKVGRVMRQRVCDEIGPEEVADAPAPVEPASEPATPRPQPPTPPPTKPGSPF